jgi:hypothetical protein
MNDSTSKLLMYETEQKEPKIINLNKDKVKISTNSINGKFWNYTNELKALHDTELDGYVLNPGKSVNWISNVR